MKILVSHHLCKLIGVALFCCSLGQAQSVITTVAGSSANGGFGGDGGLATNAGLWLPSSVLVDAAGNLYIADTNNNRIRKVTPAGIITTVAGNGQFNFSGDGGPATSATLVQPYGLAFDAAGNIYIAAYGDYRIRKLSTGGTLSTVAGGGTAGGSGDGGPATAANLNRPYGVAVDTAGNVYFSEYTTNRIRKISPSGILSTVAGNGGTGFSGDGGPAISATLNTPWGLTLDSAGNIYFVDNQNNRIRKISTSGIISTVAGNGTFGFTGDGGPATSARLAGPRGVLADSQGNLYIGDTFNHCIRKVTAGGTISTAAGICGSPGFSGDNGPATSAKLTYPDGMALDETTGTLYIADSSNNRIRKVIFGVPNSGGPSVGPPLLSFETIQGTNPLPQSLQIAGGGVINWTAQATTTSGGSWLVLSPASGVAAPASPNLLQASVNAAGLAAGVYSGSVQVTFPTVNQTQTIPVILLISAGTPSIFLSQTGLLFTGVEGGAVVPSQSFGVLNHGLGVLNWTAQASTIAGGNWLSASPAQGSSTAGSPSPGVSISATSAGLTAGSYAGFIRVDAPSSANTPQLVSAILNVLPRGSIASGSVVPTGLIFATPAGTLSPSASSLTVSTTNTATATVNVTAATSLGGNWLSAASSSFTVSAASPKTVTVQAALGTLAAGVYSGTLTLSFSDASPSQVVNVSFIVSAGAPVAASNPSAIEPLGIGKSATGCVSQKLVAVLQSSGSNFASPTAWPSLIQVQVRDDCGSAVPNAAVIATFSSGDRALALISLQNGTYTGTWQPANAAQQVTVTISASLPPLTSAQVRTQGQVNDNPSAPAVFGGGVVNGASFAAGAPLAPGSMVSVFGRKLSGAIAAAEGVPLPVRLSGSTLTVGGIEVPLFFSSEGQMNAQLPFELQPNSRQQAVVKTGLDGGGSASITVPETITIGTAAPGIFIVNAQKAGAILHADNFQLVSDSAPAAIGDFISIFSTGLGALDQSATSGALPPSPPPQTLVTPQVTIAGFPALVTYSGLAPCCVGLYQVNAQVPSGTPSGSQPLQVVINGVPSNTVTLTVR